MIRVAFCCHGNICRSTLSESVFTHKVNALGLGDQFIIDSFATSREEIGNHPHRGTVNKLREVGIPLVPHRAKQITLADYDKFDYIIGMDTANIRILTQQNQISQTPQNPLQRILSPLLLVMRIRQAEEILLQITASITALLAIAPQ